jgi:hypothetical protein
MNYLVNIWVGGQTNVDIGIKSGILFIVIKSWFNISFNVILYDGSVFNNYLMKSLACSEI